MRIRPENALVTLVWELVGKHLHRSKMKAFMAGSNRLVEAEWPGLGAATATVAP